MNVWQNEPQTVASERAELAVEFPGRLLLGIGIGHPYLGLRNYTSNLLRFGFTERDIANGGSDRLIDAIVPHGSADEIATAVSVHLSAGADHVCLQALGATGIPRDQWSALASALIA